MPDEVDGFLDERHPEAANLARWARALVRDAEPDLVARVYPGWDGIGFRHPDAGLVCALYPRGAEVRLLFEHGHALQDPDGLMDGGGRQTRYVTLRAPDPGLATPLRHLVRAAVAERLAR